MKNYIICLSRIPASLTTAQNLLNQLHSYDMPAELYEGVYGNDAVTIMQQQGRTVHPFGIKGPDAVAVPGDKSVDKMQTPGVKGCFLSHFNLWTLCAELDEPIAIWEDDIVLSRPLQPIQWQDILILALGHPKKSLKYMHYLTDPQGMPTAMDYHQSSMPGCCGYAIKPDAARTLIKTYANTYLPADNAINQHHVKIQIHSHVMGLALTEKTVKKSLTRTKFWNTYEQTS